MPRRPLADTASLALAPDGITLRWLLPGDAPSVRGCVLAVHGEGYPRDELYHPEEIVRRNSSGEWLSAVAVDEAGNVVGHAALEPTPRSRVAEIGMSLVLEGQRRRGVTEALRAFLVEEGGRLGLEGRFVEVGTSNTPMQNLVNRSPARPCGLALSLWPAFGPSAGLTAGPAPARLSFLRYFCHYRPPPPVLLHAPLHHREMLTRVYAQLGQIVEFRPGAPPDGRGELVTRPLLSWQSLFLTVHHIGADTPAQLDEAARVFQADPRLLSAYLELPLHQPGAIAACAHAERLGFFWSGVCPRFSTEGEGLRLQCLKQAPGLTEHELLHPFARELLVYTAAERERVGLL